MAVNHNFVGSTALLDEYPAALVNMGVAGNTAIKNSHGTGRGGVNSSAGIIVIDIFRTAQSGVACQTAFGDVDKTVAVNERIFGSTAVVNEHFVVVGADDGLSGKDSSLLDQLVIFEDLNFIVGRGSGADGQSKDRIGDGKGVLLTACGNGIAVDGESFALDGDGLVEVGGVPGKLVSAVCLIVGNGDGIKTGSGNV